ncbi:GDP-mannose 4,6-dehydratase [Asaia platycodi]|uniref:GDP-mannose 4,6-dehydratase n=1 Tax=Asaia platycodi TaxID=610243 RepID=UPI00046ECD78|nr:GDP-mannose 4,6-dehydratase [Asaia platycodi]
MSLRVFVTGASGFVGQHLIKCLSDRHPDWEIETSRFDVADREATRAALRQASPEVCLHLAAISSIGRAKERPENAWNVNVHGTLLLGEALREVNPEATLLFASTSEVYGDTFREGRALDEAALLSPTNLYAVTKAAADLALGALAHQGLRVVRLRPFNHTGAGQSSDFVVAAFARQLARIEAGLQHPVIQVGNLSAERDFVDVGDICLGYALCIEKRDEIASGSIINLCSGQARSVESILYDLIALFGVKVHVQTDAALMRPVDIARAVGSNERAKMLLGWEPATDWRLTLEQVVEYWRAKTRREI